MEHTGTVIRPPAEADAILIQATLGCSHGRCAFCGAYRDKPFAVRSREDVVADLQWAAHFMPRHSRLFLCDGDVLALPMPRLMTLLEDIHVILPGVRRIASYASARNLRGKSRNELEALRKAGIRMVYMGLESGSDAVLARMNKGSSVEDMIRAGHRFMEAGMKLNVTIMNGIGGVDHSMEHACLTAKAVTAMRPHQVAALSLMPLDGTPLWEALQDGSFAMPDEYGLLKELHEMVRGLGQYRGLLLANHASNLAPFKARMPADRERILTLLDGVIAGEQRLRPRWARGL